MISLCALKLASPKWIHLTRGNHETRFCVKHYGFEVECKQKYGSAIFRSFLDLFAELPLGVLIDSRVLVVHGGLFSSRQNKGRPGTIQEMQALNRRVEPREIGAVCEILWSDPMSFNGIEFNNRRGTGILYGHDVIREFLKENSIELLVRSHEGPDTRDELNEGYAIDVPGACITVFSAPNYCNGQYKNKGAYLQFDKGSKDPSFQQFQGVSQSPPSTSVEKGE